MKEGIYHMPNASEEKKVFPVVALRDLVIYPDVTVNLDIGRKESVEAVRQAEANEQFIIMVAQKDGLIEQPTARDLYKVGTLIQIKQMMQLPGNVIRIQAEGISRVKVSRLALKNGYWRAEGTMLSDVLPEDILRAEAYRRYLLDKFLEWMREMDQNIPEDRLADLRGTHNPGHIADLIAMHLPLSLEKEQYILEATDVIARLEAMKSFLCDEMEIGKLEAEINGEVRTRMDKEQEDYYLRQKIKSIHDRLGDGKSQEQEAEEYRAQLKKSGIPKDYKEKIEKEISHLATMPPMMAETVVVRNYLEQVFSLPWKHETKDLIDLDLSLIHI